MQRDWDRAAELAAVEAAGRLCRSREPGLAAKQARPSTGDEEETARRNRGLVTLFELTEPERSQGRNDLDRSSTSIA